MFCIDKILGVLRKKERKGSKIKVMNKDDFVLIGCYFLNVFELLPLNYFLRTFGVSLLKI
jgi:hypothetical protein